MSDLLTSRPLTQLAHALAGEFENQAQAAAEPTWYVHLKLWQRPVLSLSSEQTRTLFLEQATVLTGQLPYRQRILQLSDRNGALVGQYFALSDPLKFRGAGTDPALLNTITADDLVSLPNSEAPIECRPLAQGYRFQASLPEGKLCSFDYDGQQRYVYLGFEITSAVMRSASVGSAIELLTYDKGIDPDTGRGLWGALMGPFRMVKQQSFGWD